jgi:hypothetical protein
MHLELTRKFFADLIKALAAREKDAKVKACLGQLEKAIRKLGTGTHDASLGKIEDRFGGNNGNCCDVCKEGGTHSVKKSSAAKKKR